MKLVIIEGAGKKETIEKYLGKGYKVFATKGHVRDLPLRSLAVNVSNNFEPTYAVMDDKKEVVERLKEAANKASDGVFLATDPDREGEAISWHVAHLLGIDPAEPVRIVFNEISKKAVSAALESPRPVDQSLVDAQQARRVLDRLVGYKLSPVLCKKIQSKLSAGRVQSVTLRLVVEKEREIRSFKPEEYWPFFAMLQKGGDASSIKAALEKKDGKKVKLTSREEVDAALAALEGKPYLVTSVKRSITKSRPPAPFITSTLQQDAMNKLGFSLNQTTHAAQALYEGVDIGAEGKTALVTYIRTDSTRVSPDAIREAREYVAAKFGPEFIPEKPNYYASKKGAQDAHEAIRPISLERTPESLKNALQSQHYRLYKLIYERFLASQMSEAQYNALNVEIEAGKFGFKVSGKTPLFAGYTAVYSMHEDEKEDDETGGKLPDLAEGEMLALKEYKFEQKFTKPPQRYTEASLVKAMEEKGIGRPATYTPTVTILAAREYTGKDGKYLIPTELGEKVTDLLVKYFPEIMDVAFTAHMEERLDEIEDGGKVWQNVVGGFYEGLEEKIAVATGDKFTLKSPDVPTDIPCEKCGTKMVIKAGRFGNFLACPNFPSCRFTKEMKGDDGMGMVSLKVGRNQTHAVPNEELGIRSEELRMDSECLKPEQSVGHDAHIVPPRISTNSARKTGGSSSDI
ncbi:MAG: type I DNA topoisomerase, partial [Firmicutes bacterium]|nr:type I DNA topoisomerase [Bacillota bacterium]